MLKDTPVPPVDNTEAIVLLGQTGVRLGSDKDVGTVPLDAGTVPLDEEGTPVPPLVGHVVVVPLGYKGEVEDKETVPLLEPVIAPVPLEDGGAEVVLLGQGALELNNVED